MLKPIKSKAISVKNHVYRHRVAYTALVTASAFIYLQTRASAQWTEFLVEKGIDPMEFFIPEYFEELNS